MSEIRIIQSTSSHNIQRLSDQKHKPSKTKNISNQRVDSNKNESLSKIANGKLRSIEKLPSKTGGPREIQTIRKCLRKGSRICYTDMENITVLRRIPEREDSKISFVNSVEDTAFQKVDSYRSGESLFKTFTFEQTRDIEDPETVKCIEFWKSVMKKNLAPIKCTLVENNRKSAEKIKERNSLPKEKIKEHKKSEEEKKKLSFPGDGADIWSAALKEIRKKKLDQLKLYVRDRCQYCSDPFTRELKEKLGVESAEDQRSVILSLNDWKPKNEEIDLTDNLSKPTLRQRISVKAKKVSQTQTVETRMNEKSNDQTQKDQQTTSKTKILTPEEVADSKRSSTDKQADKQDMVRKPSILKSSSKISQQKTNGAAEPKKITAPQMSSVEVQAPNVRCPCESDTCVCPHKAAARNSRTSFVEIARKNMLIQDASTEKFFPVEGESCICKDYKIEPWLKLTCQNEPCPAKHPKVKIQESNSDFNLQRILQGDEEICICTKKFDVACPSPTCKNKISQGSLVQGFAETKDDKKDFCVCNTESETPCVSDVCPTKIVKQAQPVTTCVCGQNLPWSQATCQSWKCPYHRKIKIRRTDDEERITFKGHQPIKKITSTCTCEEECVWEGVTCECELCMSKKHETALKMKEKKQSVLKITLKSKSSSKDMLFGRKSKSKEKIVSTTSLDKIAKEKEKVKPKSPASDKVNKCLCTLAPPWKVVSCKKKCTMKDNSDKDKRRMSSLSIEHVPVPKEEDCVCKDVGIEPICKTHKCSNKEVHIEYPSPCICPKDFEDGHRDFRCFSETCKMKKIDKTCLCRLQPDAPCDAKTCVNKPRPSKTLEPSRKPLRYDPKCICRVRGLPNTQEITCTSPDCQLRKKPPKVVKKKVQNIFLQPPPEYKTSTEHTKCVCTSQNAAMNVKCRTATCKKKGRSGLSERSGDTTMDFADEDSANQEVCICKPEKLDQEVICNQIQCPKTSIGENGAVMNDKCVCVSLDKPCAEPTCPSVGSAQAHKICSEISQKKERPYCYICGHHDCVSVTKTKICEQVFESTEDV